MKIDDPSKQSPYLTQEITDSPPDLSKFGTIVAQGRQGKRGKYILGIIFLFLPFPPLTSPIGVIIILWTYFKYRNVHYYITNQFFVKTEEFSRQRKFRTTALQMSDIHEVEVLKGSMKPDGSFLDSITDTLGGSGNVYIRLGDLKLPETLEILDVRHPNEFATSLRNQLQHN
jgi:hypothetical protein